MPASVTEKRSARYIMAGAAMISFSGVYVKLAHVSPTVSAFYRVLIGGIVLAAIALFRREQRWLNVRYFGLQVLCGLIFAMDLFVWHKSVVFVGPGLATILGNFQVFVLALVGIAIFGERPTPRLVAAIPAAMLGLLLVVGIQWGSLAADYRAGVLFGLATAVCYSAYTLTLRHLQSRDHHAGPFANLAVVSLATAAGLGLLGLAEGESFAIPDIVTAGALGAYGVFSQVCGWVLISKGLPGIRASLAGLLLLLQPSLAYVWDILLFDLPVNLMKVAGTMITLFAIYLGSTSRK